MDEKYWEDLYMNSWVFFFAICKLFHKKSPVNESLTGGGNA